MKATTLVALVSAAGAASCSASLPPSQLPAALTVRETPSAAIAIVKVHAPWYATRGMIIRKFRAAVPQYQAAVGLERKQFSFAENGDFGGVYLWRDRALAEQWFGPAWHERVRKQRGVDGDVRFISVTRGLDGPVVPSTFEGPMVVAVSTDALDRYIGARGLRAAYEGEGLVISTWHDRDAAEQFLAGTASIEWFATPVGIVNSR